MDDEKIGKIWFERAKVLFCLFVFFFRSLIVEKVNLFFGSMNE